MAITAPLARSVAERPAVNHISKTRFLALLLPMAVAMYGAFQGSQYVLIPVQMQTLDPAGKVVDLAAVVMLTAITGALGTVFGGWATDVTRTSWGGRAPWLLGMGLVSAALFAAIGAMGSVLAVAVVVGLVWFTLNTFQGAMLTALAARPAPRDRALVAGVFAISGPVGGIYGYNFAALTGGLKGYAGLALIFLALALLYLAFGQEGPDPPPPPHAQAPGRPDTVFASFRKRDFLLAYVFRLALFAGQATIMNYLIYFMTDRVGLENVPGHSAEIANGDIASLRTACNLIGLALGLLVLRHTNRRKPYLQTYALVTAVAMLAPSFWPTWNALLIYGALGGLAWGFYSTIDIALMNMVLPNPATKGRDLAMLAMAGSLAQLIGPPLSSLLIHSVGYIALFQAGAILTLGAGLAAGYLKSVP